MSQDVELYLEREMPTAGGSEDPADFVITGDIDGRPPSLYPAVSYLAPDGMEIDGNIVTARIKIEPRPVLPICFMLRLITGAGEFWSVTPAEMLYVSDPETGNFIEFNFAGDLGSWLCQISAFYINAVFASGPQEVGGAVIPAGSVAVDIESRDGSITLTSPQFSSSLAITTATVTFDYFTFEDPWERGNRSSLELFWEIGTYGEPGWDYGSSEFSLEACEAGENVFNFSAIPVGALIRVVFMFTGSSDGRLIASMASIKLTE
jgi:hypothetical protein